MQKPVKIDDIVEAMEIQTDECSAYLNRETGAVVILSYDELWAAEEDSPLEKYPAWQHENIEKAREILEDDQGVYVQLPTKFEIHEWQIMDRFAWWIEDERISEELRYAIRGKGAFRRFERAIHRFGVEKVWYAYRERALWQMAVDWCKANSIPFEES